MGEYLHFQKKECFGATFSIRGWGQVVLQPNQNAQTHF
ncbi:Hypothetical protein BROD_0302 [Brucella sp. NF 2653]|nr:Hypothetical protein BROD_0302 [Brucella sp. NF 2653]